MPSKAPTNISAIVDKQTITVTWRKPKLPYLYEKLSGYKVIIHDVNNRQGTFYYNVYPSNCR